MFRLKPVTDTPENSGRNSRCSATLRGGGPFWNFRYRQQVIWLRTGTVGSRFFGRWLMMLLQYYTHSSGYLEAAFIIFRFQRTPLMAIAGHLARPLIPPFA